MSDLTQFRDHARFMADRNHAPGCPPERANPTRPHRPDGTKWCGTTTAHDRHPWQAQSEFSGLTFDWTCHGICGGCVTDKQRALWTKLATEIDDYLHDDQITNDVDVALFEEA